MLGLEPSGAETEFDAPPGHRIDLRDADRERAGQPEGGCGHERTQAQPRRFPRQASQREPRVGGAGQAVTRAHRQVVVGAEEAVVASVLGDARDPQQVIIAGPLLGLREDPQVHDRRR